MGWEERTAVDPRFYFHKFFLEKSFIAPAEISKNEELGAMFPSPDTTP